MFSKTIPSKTSVQPPLSAQNKALLEVRDLCVEYLTVHGPVRAVNHVSFSIAPGEVFGLAGESGSGKSTIAQALLRILRPPALITNGEVLFDGLDVLDMDDHELDRFRWNEVAMVFQSAMNALNPVMTIADQITDVIARHRPQASKKQARERAAELLELVGIDTDRLDSYPHELSGGMRQRVGIAIALALQPRLLLMDEPTTALDVVVQRDILERIEKLQKAHQFAVLFITHDMSLMVEFAHRIGIMYAGSIVEMSPARVIFDEPLHPYTNGLMNSFPPLTGELHTLAGIAGSPPDLRNLPSGCPFNPRCAERIAPCSVNLPMLEAQGNDRYVACHLYPTGESR